MSNYNYTYNQSTIPTSNVSYTSTTGASAKWPSMGFSNGTSATDWGTVTISNHTTDSTLHVRGDAEIQGDLKVQGKSIVDSLERIEERLAILRPNEELEEKWENLRGLRKMYMELEAEIIEKEKIWKILKD